MGFQELQPKGVLDCFYPLMGRMAEQKKAFSKDEVDAGIRKVRPKEQSR